MTGTYLAENLIEWWKELTDSTNSFEFFKIDLFMLKSFCLLPGGDLISLLKPPFWILLSVHTQLGIHCIGAKVDGKLNR